MSKFPHEITMTTYGLSVAELSDEAQEALDDFEQYRDFLQQKKEAAQSDGNDFVLTEAERRKLMRLSQTICSEIEDMVNSDDEEDRGDTNKKGGFDLFAWMK
jgi:hypothetical protein